MRTISEITHNSKTLQTILDDHKKWVFSDADSGTRANLGGADLSGANLSAADLGGADLRGADLSGANLSAADLGGVYLRGADLTRAGLRAADLGGVDLTRADLWGVDLRGATGIYQFGPIGDIGRIGYAVAHEDGPMFALGCYWGDLADTRKAIVKKYGRNSLYEKQVILAGKIVMEAK